MEMEQSHDSSLIIQTKTIVGDLLAPKQWIYWLDFLSSVSVGWAAFAATLFAPIGPAAKVITMLVSVLALYRAVIFIHELTHLDPNSFKAFRFVWNLICGIPLLIPSFTYTGVHSDHHKRKVYGTDADGEYVAFATKRPLDIIAYVLLFPLLPLLQLIRFALLTPISYLHPGLRSLLWRRASSLTIDLAYVRSDPAPRDGRFWRLQEFAAMVFSISMIALVAGGVVPTAVIVLWYVTASSVFFLNSLRTLAAHCYRNPGDRVMDITEQYLDSVNVPGNVVTTGLWAPVGLRYHATHHLMQRLPYHSLGRAHRRLVAELPNNAVYLSASRRSLADALAKLWIDAGDSAAPLPV